MLNAENTIRKYSKEGLEDTHHVGYTGGKNPKGQKEETAKVKGKGNDKLSYDPKPKIPPPPKREHLAKDSICHHCKGLRESRKLKHGALSLYMGNGMRAPLKLSEVLI
ncbi:hypothetical protein Tco_1338818 [Tanacetum coccineum]